MFLFVCSSSYPARASLAVDLCESVAISLSQRWSAIWQPVPIHHSLPYLPHQHPPAWTPHPKYTYTQQHNYHALLQTTTAKHSRKGDVSLLFGIQLHMQGEQMQSDLLLSAEEERASSGCAAQFEYFCLRVGGMMQARHLDRAHFHLNQKIIYFSDLSHLGVHTQREREKNRERDCVSKRKSQ